MCRAQSKLKNIRPAVQAIVHVFQRSGRSCKGCKIGKAVFVDHCSSSTLSNAPLRFGKPCISNFVQPLLVNFQTRETHFCWAMRSLQKNAFHKALQRGIAIFRNRTSQFFFLKMAWTSRMTCGRCERCDFKKKSKHFDVNTVFQKQTKVVRITGFPLHHGQSQFCKKYVIQYSVISESYAT